MRRRASLSITTTTVALSRPHAYKEWRPPRLPTPRFRKTVPLMITTARSPVSPVPSLSFFDADTPIDDMVLARVYREPLSAQGISTAGYKEVVEFCDGEGILAASAVGDRRSLLPARLDALAMLTGSKDAAPSSTSTTEAVYELSQASDEWTRREHRRRSQSICHPSGSTTSSEAPPSQSSITSASTTPSTLTTPSPSLSPVPSPCPSQATQRQSKAPRPSQTQYRALPTPLLPPPSPSPLPALSPRFLFPRTPPLPPTLRAGTRVGETTGRERIGGYEVGMSPVRLCFRCSRGDVRMEKVKGDGGKGVERGVERKKEKWGAGMHAEKGAEGFEGRRMRGVWGVGLSVVLVRWC